MGSLSRIPPFGGEFDTVIPHMTVGWSDEGATAEVVTELLGDVLPVSASVHEVTLLAEEVDGWVVRRTFPLK